MKLLIVASFVIAGILFVNANLPDDIPETLRPLAMSLKELVDQLPKLPNGFPDFSKASDDLKAKVQEFKDAFEKATGRAFPMPPAK